MIKDNTHDYALAAFRFYAMCGCPTDDMLMDMIRSDSEIHHDSVEIRNKRRSRRLLTEADLVEEQCRRSCSELKCYIDDVAAVNSMLEEIGGSPSGEDKLLCIRYIYFAKGVNLKVRGNMSALIQRCAVDTGLNETFIYRALRQAREVFARRRGLSCSESELALRVFGTDGSGY